MSAAGKIPADHEARARIRDEHATSMIVEAAAGTGKTTALVGRMIAMVRAGTCELARVVAVTFTEKAAGELTLRIRAELEEARAASEGAERARCERALAELETARIGTIHGLCADLLRERPVEAGVDPSFTLLAEDEAEGLVARAVSEVLEAALGAPGEGLRRLVRRTAGGEGIRERVREAVRPLVDHRDHRAPWRRDPFDRAAEIDAILLDVAELGALHARALQPSDWAAKSLEIFARFAADLRAREAIAPRDHDGLEAALADLVAPRRREWGWRGSGRMFAKDVPRADVLARRDALKARIERFLERADADLAALLRADLAPIVERYEALKRRAGALDFLDLLLETRRMLVDRAEVRAELQARFTHVFVDELQDTDPVQCDVVLLLASDDPDVTDPREVRPVPGKLFLVGDPKQSIYRFRRADVATYARLTERLVSRGVALLHLTTSFRSLPGIQRVVNAAFSAAITSAEGQPSYVPLTEWREPEAKRPSVIALGIPRPYEQSERPAKVAVDRSTPDAVAAMVAWLVQESGWKVLDPASGQEVPIEPRHVCLLFRRQQDWSGADVVRPYLRGLEARRVPHVSAFGRSFHDRDEIVALRSLAAAIEHPDDALSVYAALHGPFLALTDATLLVFLDRMKHLDPMRRIDRAGISTELVPVADALELLRELHLGRNRAPIADTFARFFERTRAHASLALAHGGEQVLAGAMRILDVARRAEQRGALSFRGFVELLEDQARRGEGIEGAAIEEGQEGVRVMTVHKAKGLEFPVVVLCDPSASDGAWVDQWVDPDRGEAFFKLTRLVPVELRERAAQIEAANAAETVRLAYVAATRARDLLIVPACGDQPLEESWLSVLSPALYPAAADKRKGDGRAPGCPQFGEDSVLHRSSEAEAAGATSVRPGLHRALGVVWWDPAVLKLDAEPAEGLRSEELLRSVPGVDDGSRAHRAWQEARDRAREDGKLATVPATSIRDAARRPRGVDEPTIERAGAPRGPRPEGKRIDALFRGALAIARAGDDAATLAGIVGARARALGADEEEESAVLDALGRVLAHPWLAEASPDRRAVPIVAPEGSGLVEGTIDLVREDASGAVAVRIALADEPSEALRAEASIAAEALGAATGRPARAALLLG